MKVQALLISSEEGETIVGVFSSLEKTEKYILENARPDDYRVEEWEVDKPLVCKGFFGCVLKLDGSVNRVWEDFMYLRDGDDADETLSYVKSEQFYGRSFSSADHAFKLAQSAWRQWRHEHPGLMTKLKRAVRKK